MVAANAAPICGFVERDHWFCGIFYFPCYRLQVEGTNGSSEATIKVKLITLSKFDFPHEIVILKRAPESLQ